MRSSVSWCLARGRGREHSPRDTHCIVQTLGRKASWRVGEGGLFVVVRFERRSAVPSDLEIHADLQDVVMSCAVKLCVVTREMFVVAEMESRKSSILFVLTYTSSHAGSSHWRIFVCTSNAKHGAGSLPCKKSD